MTKEGTVLRRTGRVLFWLGLSVFGLIAAICVYGAFNDPENASVALSMGAMFGLPWYLGGRALCYMLAGE